MLYNFIMSNDLGTIEMKKSFKDLTTVGIGGLIDYYIKPKDIESLRKIYLYLIKNNITYFIIGKGSNTLAKDEDFKGVVISLDELERYYKIENNYLTVSSNYSTISLAYSLALINKGDLSYLGGIPGTVGGAVYNNSGAYNKSIKDDLISVKYLDTSGNIITLLNKDLDFKYRYSIFHNIPGIILEATFNIEDIETKDILLSRKKRRMESQPLNEKSLGSIFKNPLVMPSYQVIDLLNLRGFNVGDAYVSTKHANFIVNKGKAKYYDFIKLIEIITKKSYNRLGIELEYEITII